MPDPVDAPAWAAPDVYPAKPSTAPYGALSRKDRQIGFDSFEALAAHVCSSRQSVVAVWGPERERLVPPEAVPELLEPLRTRFVDLAERGMADGKRNAVIFGILLLYALYAAASNKILPQDSQNVGLAGFLLLVLGLLPLYEAWKARRTGWELNAENLVEEAHEARFEHWMDRQRMPMTWAVLFLIFFVGVAQIWVGVETSMRVAGLEKNLFRAGEWWRVLTAPFLHGNILHWGLNSSALWYLGRRTEALVGWPHLLLAFLISMVAGGEASAHFLPDQASIGASGGVLGVLGLLMGFELLHQRLVPRSARRRLAVGVVATFVIGLVGYSIIDNAAHAGGLVAGLLYAVVVFPKSRSPRRPKANRVDRVAGVLAGGILTASALWAFWLMVSS